MKDNIVKSCIISLFHTTLIMFFNSHEISKMSYRTEGIDYNLLYLSRINIRECCSLNFGLSINFDYMNKVTFHESNKFEIVCISDFKFIPITKLFLSTSNFINSS